VICPGQIRAAGDTGAQVFTVSPAGPSAQPLHEGL
jgi:hypothetical protein